MLLKKKTQIKTIYFLYKIQNKKRYEMIYFFSTRNKKNNEFFFDKIKNREEALKRFERILENNSEMSEFEWLIYKQRMGLFKPILEILQKIYDSKTNKQKNLLYNDLPISLALIWTHFLVKNHDKKDKEVTLDQLKLENKNHAYFYEFLLEFSKNEIEKKTIEVIESSINELQKKITDALLNEFSTELSKEFIKIFLNSLISNLFTSIFVYQNQHASISLNAVINNLYIFLSKKNFDEKIIRKILKIILANLILWNKPILLKIHVFNNKKKIIHYKQNWVLQLPLEFDKYKKYVSISNVDFPMIGLPLGWVYNTEEKNFRHGGYYRNNSEIATTCIKELNNTILNIQENLKKQPINTTDQDLIRTNIVKMEEFIEFLKWETPRKLLDIQITKQIDKAHIIFPSIEAEQSYSFELTKLQKIPVSFDFEIFLTIFSIFPFKAFKNQIIKETKQFENIFDSLSDFYKIDVDKNEWRLLNLQKIKEDLLIKEKISFDPTTTRKIYYTLNFVYNFFLTNLYFFHNNIFYFVLFLDFRGRQYYECQYSHMQNTIIRPLLLLNPDKQIQNLDFTNFEKTFNLLKINFTKISRDTQFDIEKILTIDQLKEYLFYFYQAWMIKKRKNLIDLDFSELKDFNASWSSDLNNFLEMNKEKTKWEELKYLKFRKPYNWIILQFRNQPKTISLDACASILQFLAILTDNLTLAKLVNIQSTFLDDINDPYFFIIEQIEIAFKNKKWPELKTKLTCKEKTKREQQLELFKVLITDRFIIKQVLMTYLYGSTPFAMVDNLQENGHLLAFEKKELILIFSTIVNIFNNLFPDFKLLKNTFKYIALFLATNRKIIKMIPNSNFQTYPIFEYCYNEMKDFNISTTAFTTENENKNIKQNQNITITIKTKGTEISKKKFISGILANFIHFLDAQVLHATRVDLKNQGIDTLGVHDCFIINHNFYLETLRAYNKNLAKISDVNILDSFEINFDEFAKFLDTHIEEIDINTKPEQIQKDQNGNIKKKKTTNRKISKKMKQQILAFLEQDKKRSTQPKVSKKAIEQSTWSLLPT